MSESKWQQYVEMNNAVAYGFHETRKTIRGNGRWDILTRLLQRNHQRHAEEVALGLQGKAEKATCKKATKKDCGQLSIFD